MSLSREYREALMNGVVIQGRGFIHNPRCGQVNGNRFLVKPREGDRLAGCCHRMSATASGRALDEIVQDAVRDALNSAADAIEATCPPEYSTAAHGRIEAARIVRNLAANAGP